MRNVTWESTKLPEDKVPRGSKWFFKTRFNTDGTIDKYKGIMVENSYS